MFSHLDKRACLQPYCKPCGKGAHLLLHRGDIGRGERLGLGKADLPVVAHGKHPVDHAAVEVHMRIQCGAGGVRTFIPSSSSGFSSTPDGRKYAPKSSEDDGDIPRLPALEPLHLQL